MPVPDPTAAPTSGTTTLDAENNDDTQPSLGLTQRTERERGGEVVGSDDDAQQQQLKTTNHR